MGRLFVLVLLVCLGFLHAAGATETSSTASADAPLAVIAPATGMAQPALAAGAQQFVQPRPTPLEADRRNENLWRWSAVALVASSGFDAASSYGKYEANHMLASSDGTFGMKGVAVKSALAVSILSVEQLIRRRYGHSKALAIANFLQAGLVSGVAARNLSIPRAR